MEDTTMIHIRIDTTVLKGKKFAATEEEKKIMQYMIKTTLDWYHELNYENFTKFLTARSDIIYPRTEDTPAERNAIFWVKQIAEHHISMEYNVKIMS